MSENNQNALLHNRIFITGANGGIGSVLVADCARQGYETVSLVYSSDSNVPKDPKIKIVYGDVNDPVVMAAATKNIDVLIHCALPHGNPQKGLITTLNAALGNQCKLVIFFSSWVVYAGNTPDVENGHQEEEEIRSSKKNDRYTENKIQEEDLVKRICKNAGVDYVILRPSLVYGERAKRGYGKILKILSVFPFTISANFVDLIHVSDVSKYVLKIIENKKCRNSIYNLGGYSYPSDVFFHLSTRMLGKHPYKLSSALTSLICKFLPSSLWFFKTKALLNSNKIRRATEFLPEIKFEDFTQGKCEKTFYPDTYSMVKDAYLHLFKSFSVVGKGYSFFDKNEPVPKKSIINMSKLDKILSVTGTFARVQAGSTLCKFIMDLDRYELTLPILPEFLYVSIGACIMTPVHGSSISGSCVADFAREITYLKDGQMFSVRHSDPEWDKIILSKGVIILDVLFECVKTFYLKKNCVIEDELVLTNLEQVAKSNYSISIYWDMISHKTLIWKFNIAKEPSKNLIQGLFHKTPKDLINYRMATILFPLMDGFSGKSFLLMKNFGSIGYFCSLVFAKKIRRFTKVKTLEFAVPIENAEEFLHELSNEFRKIKTRIPLVLIRFGAVNKLFSRILPVNPYIWVAFRTRNRNLLDIVCLLSKKYPLYFHTGKYVVINSAPI